MVSIYRLISTRDVTDIRYVGKTVNPLKHRLRQHLSGGCGQYTKNWIRKELKDGYDINIQLIEEVDDSMWEEKERFWILYYLQMGYELCNIQSGGIQSPGNSSLNHQHKKQKLNKKLLEDFIKKENKRVCLINRKGKVLREYTNAIVAAMANELSTIKVFNCCERRRLGEDCHIKSLRFVYEGTPFIKRKYTHEEVREELKHYFINN